MCNFLHIKHEQFHAWPAAYRGAAPLNMCNCVINEMVANNKYCIVVFLSQLYALVTCNSVDCPARNVQNVDIEYLLIWLYGLLTIDNIRSVISLVGPLGRELDWSEKTVTSPWFTWLPRHCWCMGRRGPFQYKYHFSSYGNPIKR